MPLSRSFSGPLRGPSGFRVAVYYAPELDDPLWDAGCRWLGRDPETGAARPQPAIPDIEGVTRDARLYGLHCTLKPPMRLLTPYPEFLADAAALAATLRPFALPQLAVRDLSGFLALRETEPCPALRGLADACVAGLDRHRAPPDEAELARRRKSGLSPGREAMLRRWGYPGVFDEWRFHMTLTRRLTAPERNRFLPQAEAHLAAALAYRRHVTALSIFTQAAQDAPFLVAERLAFGH